MNITTKWSLSRAKAKFRKWMKEVDAEAKESLTAYAADFTRLAVKFTPPAGKHAHGAKALRQLRERIRQDFEGAPNARNFSEGDIIWRTTSGGHRYAFFDNGSGKYHTKARPFRIITGRVTAKKLAGLNKGKYGVRHAGGNLQAFIASCPQQYRWLTNNKNTVRLRAYGPRHLATPRAVKEEIRRRQFLAGRLMAGWKPIARRARAKLPAAAERHSGNGSVGIRKSGAHGAVMTARNRGNFRNLQRIIDANVPALNKAMKKTAGKRKRALAKKLQQT